MSNHATILLLSILDYHHVVWSPTHSPLLLLKSAGAVVIDGLQRFVRLVIVALLGEEEAR